MSLSTQIEIMEAEIKTLKEKFARFERFLPEKINVSPVRRKADPLKKFYKKKIMNGK